jgi:hypothetical protein
MPIVAAYFYWYYFEKTKDVINIIWGYIRYWVFFFSVKQILNSLFSPWKMMDLPQKGNMIEEIFQTAFNNLISRVLGLLIRLVLLCVFMIMEVITIVIGVSIFILWIFMPIALVWIIIYSFTKINV